MCGVAGAVSFLKDIDNQSLLVEHFTNSIIYRGPDETGVFAEPNAILLNNRFSIIGKSNGSQPFFSRNGQVVSVYNGEIYNFRELRRELEGDGIVFEKNTDGEVIPHLYEKYGPDFINKLNGAYAIVIYDVKKKKVFLGRDRFGIRPLFYAFDQGTLYFGSEAKTFLPFLSNRKISKSSIFSFTQCSFLKSPLSMFEGVNQVEASCYITFDEKSIIKKQRYWDLPLDKEKLNVTRVEALKHIKEMLIDSVKLRLESDVPVGVYLSGGIDSSVISKVVSDLNDKSVDSFTIDFENKTFSEAEKAKSFAAKYNLNHQAFTHSDESSVSNFPKLIKHTECILNTGSPMAFHSLANFAKKKVDVVLGGEGADEVFCGYGFQNIEYKRGQYLKWYYAPFMPFIKYRLKKTDQYNNFFPPVSEVEYVKEIFGKFSPGWQFFARKGEKLLKLLHIKGINSKEEKIKVKDQFSSFIDFSKNISNFDFMTYIDFRTWLEHHLLVINGDRPSMAATIESRYPYLDYRLVEYVCRLPSSFKVNGNISKSLLRDISIDGIDKKVMDRKKVPFLAPACKQFFNQSFKDKYSYIDYFTSVDVIARKGYFNDNVLVDVKKELEIFHNTNEQDKNRSYGDLHIKESVFLTVLSVNLLDEIFVQGNSIENIMKGEFCGKS